MAGIGGKLAFTATNQPESAVWSLGKQRGQQDVQHHIG